MSPDEFRAAVFVDDGSLSASPVSFSPSARGTSSSSAPPLQSEIPSCNHPNHDESPTIARESSVSELGSSWEPVVARALGAISRKVPDVPVSWSDIQSLFLEHMAPAAPPGEAVPETRFGSGFVHRNLVRNGNVQDMTIPEITNVENPNLEEDVQIDDPDLPEPTRLTSQA